MYLYIIYNRIYIIYMLSHHPNKLHIYNIYIKFMYTYILFIIDYICIHKFSWIFTQLPLQIYVFYITVIFQLSFKEWCDLSQVPSPASNQRKELIMCLALWLSTLSKPVIHDQTGAWSTLMYCWKLKK